MTGFAVIPYIQGVTEPIKIILIATTLTLIRNLFRLRAYFLPNLRILSRKNNEPTLSILFLAMTVIVSTSDRPNVSLIHVWKSIKERSPFCEKENSALSERTCLTNHIVGWDKSKIITTSRLYHQPGILTPPTLLNSWWWRLTTWRYLHLVKTKCS